MITKLGTGNLRVIVSSLFSAHTKTCRPVLRTLFIANQAQEVFALQGARITAMALSIHFFLYTHPSPEITFWNLSTLFFEV